VRHRVHDAAPALSLIAADFLLQAGGRTAGLFGQDCRVHRRI
jgi:hypothetical protein